MRVHIEITDTFGGEANYSWVKRRTLELPENTSDHAIVRRVKKEIEWNGWKTRTDNYGDMIVLHPRNACIVCFITFGGNQ